MITAVNGRHRRVYNTAILMGSNGGDPADFLRVQAGPGGEGVVTVFWNNSSHPDIVRASEVILLTADTHPPDNIPPAGDDNVAPWSEAENLFDDSEDIKDPADEVANEPQEATERQEAVKPQEVEWCDPSDDEGWG